ncbi:MAG: Gfo/Idh/MocA family oxidoreductase [Verrucomicrobiae bacterium]|nr:Gfo/Idh/MocA family oxidoreductase [Verrucomicrobiae bacterium]
MPTRRSTLVSLASGVAATTVPAILRGAGAKKTPLKYVQIGTGHAHANKIDAYRKSPDWEVLGVAEPDPERVASAKASKTYGDLPFLTVEQALNLPGLAAVGIETEVRDLLKYAEMAIDAGFHIHLDKPAGESLPPLRRIHEKAGAKGLTVQMGYMYRFNPAVVTMRDLLKKGWLGEPFEVETVMSKVVDAKGRRGLEEYPGGIMFELGCHIIDLTVGVLGMPDKVTAFPRQTIGGDSLMDNMLAVFEYPRATATVRSAAVEVEGGARRHFTVCGTEGTCHIQPLDRPAIRLALSRARDGGLKKGYQDIPFEPPYSRYVGDCADLAAVIRGEKASEFDSAHDLAVQECVLRASGLEKALG